MRRRNASGRRRPWKTVERRRHRKGALHCWPLPRHDPAGRFCRFRLQQNRQVLRALTWPTPNYRLRLRGNRTQFHPILQPAPSLDLVLDLDLVLVLVLDLVLDLDLVLVLVLVLDLDLDLVLVLVLV
ncbi:hypothetical protein EYF80_001571 [Liparis tanakae]|uniref:Uncharacterized protein n=1 Tax=Liparis tanakae TaxID=230148 RepID=A0A4Z2JDJ6_9TELE|nr:hypothetical protein EYF80_001571 [Liparis tanakae]